MECHNKLCQHSLNVFTWHCYKCAVGLSNDAKWRCAANDCAIGDELFAHFARRVWMNGLHRVFKHGVPKNAAIQLGPAHNDAAATAWTRQHNVVI